MTVWTSFFIIRIVCNCEFKQIFLIHWYLYHLLFDLETNFGVVINHLLMAYIWEKAKSILMGNLNSNLIIFLQLYQKYTLVMLRIISITYLHLLLST